jgi:ATP:ADP antiporter, AAA family
MNGNEGLRSGQAAAPAAHASVLDRALRVFGDVRPGEGMTVVLLCSNVFVLLTAYYILKVVREPLILATGGAELKSYAAAAQAAALALAVPAYGWLASRVSRTRLLVTVLVFHIACIESFAAGGRAGVPGLGFAFYVWLGTFSLMVIAQFWSFANDVVTRAEGERLFPLVGVGSTAGAPVGAWIAARMFGLGIAPAVLMQVAAGAVVLHLLLYIPMARRRPAPGARPTPTGVAGDRLGKADGFRLVLGNPYIRLVMLLLVLLNLVNTIGEYVLSRTVVNAASFQYAAGLIADREAFIGSVYGRFNLGVSLAAVLMQAFLSSRLVKRFGIAGVLFVLPVVALGSYGLVAAGATALMVAYVKLAENASDYSLMNTAKQMLWLPTSREEKYNAKQAVDTFFVRGGDVLAAGAVFVGTSVVGLGVRGFGLVNVGLTIAWLALSVAVFRRYRAWRVEEVDDSGVRS